MTGDDETRPPDDSQPSGRRFPGEEDPGPGRSDAPPPEPSRSPEAAPARLVRSTSDRWIAGVAGGLGSYFGIDAVLVRIGIVVLALVTAVVPVVAGYIVAWAVIPEAGETKSAAKADTPSDTTTRVILGALLISLGSLLLVNALLPGWLRADVIAALVVVAIGLAVIAQGARR